jgi:hypothetical protein
MSSHPFAESFDLEAAFVDMSNYWSPKSSRRSTIST